MPDSTGTQTYFLVGLLAALPIAWGVVEYHQCPHDLGADEQGPCPDWTREATIGTPPEGL